MYNMNIVTKLVFHFTSPVHSCQLAVNFRRALQIWVQTSKIYRVNGQSANIGTYKENIYWFDPFQLPAL